MGETVVSVERLIDAPAAPIFAILADASRHPEIDGSGSVRGAKEDAPEHLSLGARTADAMSKTLERLAPAHRDARLVRKAP